jgi:hypothetical protein
MHLYEALNLLQSIETAGTDATQLETILTATINGSESNAAGFGAFMNIRANSRRMAANTVTMAAINGSAKAIQLVFANTSEHNFSIIQEITKNSSAMSSVCSTLSSLEAVVANDVAWSYFKESSSYEPNIIKVLCTLVGTVPSLFNSVADVIADSTSMGAIASNPLAMKALIASGPAMSAAANNTLAMTDIVNEVPAITAVANSDSAMAAVASSQKALDEFLVSTRVILQNTPSALRVLAANASAWDHLMSTSATLTADIYSTLVALNNFDTAVHVDVADLFTDAIASTTVANSGPSMVAIIYEVGTATTAGVTSAMDKIIASENLATVLGSSSAIKNITANTPTMENLIANPIAFPILVASPLAKATIFNSDSIVSGVINTGTMFYKMMNNSDARAVLASSAQSLTVTNDTLVNTFKSSGVAGNIIVMTAQMGSLVAATNVVTFQSAGVPATVFSKSVPGVSLVTSPVPIDRPYTDMELDLNVAAGTAAGNVNLTYVAF